MASVYVATPYSKPYNAQYWKSLIQSSYNFDGELEHKDLYGYGIEAARNYLVDCFKASKRDFLLWVDSDASWESGAIQRLVNHNLPVVCGCMYTRDAPIPSPTMGKYAGKGQDGKTYYKFADTAKMIMEHCWNNGIDEVERNDICLPETENDIQGIDGCGLHFTLIRKDVIESLEQPLHVMLGKTGAGEDFYFCKKARDAGFKLYVDLGVHVGHCLNDERDVGIKDMLHIMGLFDRETIEFNDILPEVLEIG